MRTAWKLLLAVAGVLALAAPADAQDRYSLANGCWELVAPGGAVGRDDGGYRVGAPPERFFAKATDLGSYMLHGKAGELLTSADDAVTAGTEPGPAADWVVDAKDGGFTLRRQGTDRHLSAGDGTLTTGGATVFSFRATDGCTAFPEIDTSTSGTPAKGATPYTEVRGYSDLHLHHMAFDFLGGKAHCGRPWSPYGVSVALVDCPDHYPDGRGAILETTYQGNPGNGHDPVGWPTFKDWPHQGSYVHEQTYYKWVERAYLGGLRLMTVLFVENGQLCEIYPYKQNSCDEMEAVRRQSDALNRYQDYIDAQSGGPGKGWFRIVGDPFEARRVINQGKLAVIPGVEISRPFNCTETNHVPECDRAQIDRELDDLQRRGVVQMELVNKYDNALVGVAGDAGTTGYIVNTGNLLETGHFWDMRQCPTEHDHDREQTGAPGVDRDPLVSNVLRTLAPGLPLPGTYGPPPHCNQQGLTELGAYTLRRMAERKMIFDPDHMSVIGRDQAMSVMESMDYSGVVSSHSWSTPDTYRRIQALGGVVTPHEKSAKSMVEAWKFLREHRDPRFYWGIGYGTDQNGFASQAPPRPDNAKNPVVYPFKSLDGKVTLDRQKSGERVFDLNKDGVAHYGLYPDLMEDFRKVAGDQIIEDMARGVEAYLQMWERVHGVPVGPCRPRTGKVSARGVGRVRIGAGVERTLRRAKQPQRRIGRRMRWCVSGRKRDRVVAVFTKGRRPRVGFAGATARTHRLGRVRTGMRARRVAGRRLGKRLIVRPARRGRTFVFGVRKGRVRFVGVASRAASASPKRLRGYVKRSRLLRR